jgi:hypothetical protein
MEEKTMRSQLVFTLILGLVTLGCGPDKHLKMAKDFLKACEHYRQADGVVDEFQAARYVKNEDVAADVEMVRHIMTGTCPLVASQIKALERAAAEQKNRDELLEEDEDLDLPAEPEAAER